MKLGKSKLGKILAKEVGMLAKDVRVYGKYKCYGNKEVIILGAHTIVAMDGEISIMEPVHGSFEDNSVPEYQKRIIKHKNERSDTAVTVEHSTNKSISL